MTTKRKTEDARRSLRRMVSPSVWRTLCRWKAATRRAAHHWQAGRIECSERETKLANALANDACKSIRG